MITRPFVHHHHVWWENSKFELCKKIEKFIYYVDITKLTEFETKFISIQITAAILSKEIFSFGSSIMSVKISRESLTVETKNFDDKITTGRTQKRAILRFIARFFQKFSSFTTH
jgi:hypothetical protein